MPDSSKEEHLIGTVIAKGAGFFVDQQFIECPVDVGQTIAFKKYGGYELEVGNKTYKIVQFQDLIARIEEDKEDNA